MHDPQNGTDNLIVCNLVDRLSQSSIFELYSKGLGEGGRGWRNEGKGG